MKIRLLSLGFAALIAVSACTQTSAPTDSSPTSSENSPTASEGTEPASSPPETAKPAASEQKSDQVAASSQSTPPPSKSESAPAIAPQSGGGYSQEFAYYNKTSDEINVRTGPGEDAPIKGTLAVDAGGYVQACATEPDWCEITYGDDGGTGWVYMPLLSGLPDPELVDAAAKPQGNANCVVKGAGGVVRFEGSCNFSQSGGNGSFSIESTAGPIDGTSLISVSIIQPGVAEVRGLTTDGGNSRWGEARRSTSDPACWVGSDFEVCAY